MTYALKLSGTRRYTCRACFSEDHDAEPCRFEADAPIMTPFYCPYGGDAEWEVNTLDALND